MDIGVQRKTPTGLSVLVAGAGVGGLMAALECWRQGLEVRIIEKAATDSLHGDSFAIGTSALAVLKHWPKMEAKRKEIAFDPTVTIHNEKGELVKGPIDFSAFISADLDREKYKPLRFSRPEFHSMLLEQLEALGVKVEYGKGAADYFEDASTGIAGVVLQDGSKIEANAVIAADGRRGRSQPLITGAPVPSRSSGRSIFRASYPRSVIEDDAKITERYPAGGRPVFEMWNTPTFSAGFGTTKNTVDWMIDHVDTGSAEESWSHNTPVEEVLNFISSAPALPDFVNRIIRATPGGKVIDWKLMWRDPQPKWTSPAGLVCQIGDAAHAFLPTSGNGATQALEDAVSLAACLSVAGKGKVKEATETHNLLRFERTSYLQAFGVANAKLRESEEARQKGKMMHAAFGAWILAHDPETYAVDNYEGARAHLYEGKPFKNTNTPPDAVYKPWTFESLVEDMAAGKPTLLDW